MWIVHLGSFARPKISDDAQYTIIDVIIGEIGYVVSRMNPYSPMDLPLPQGSVPVVAPGTCIETKTEMGALSICSGAGLLRTLSWSGAQRSIQLSFHQIEPHLNGFTFPARQYGEFWPGDWWEIVDGITRCKYREGIREFGSTDDALKWLGELQSQGWPVQYTSDGLVVAWSKTAGHKTLGIEVWQILVRGHKPHNLKGNSGESIQVIQKN